MIFFSSQIVYALFCLQECNKEPCKCDGIKGALGSQGPPGVSGQEGDPGDVGYDGKAEIFMNIIIAIDRSSFASYKYLCARLL